MVTFRNNNSSRRSNFRRNERTFKSNGDRQKYNNNFTNNDNFKRKSPGRNNHNAAKLIDKYNDLAREASSNGDKILSENYMQHADHFTRVFNEKENYKREKFSENKLDSKSSSEDNINTGSIEASENSIIENSEKPEVSNSEKPQVEAN